MPKLPLILCKGWLYAVWTDVLGNCVRQWTYRLFAAVQLYKD
jgi:predicted DCC family thiol-disulfide oxidoreductase YuxK